VGSAEGQPASNKVDVYTIIRQWDISCCFFIIGNLYGLRKLIRVVLKIQSQRGFHFWQIKPILKNLRK